MIRAAVPTDDALVPHAANMAPTNPKTSNSIPIRIGYPFINCVKREVKKTNTTVASKAFLRCETGPGVSGILAINAPSDMAMPVARSPK